MLTSSHVALQKNDQLITCYVHAKVMKCVHRYLKCSRMLRATHCAWPSGLEAGSGMAITQVVLN